MTVRRSLPPVMAARAGGIGGSKPSTGATLSGNLAGCAVDRATTGPPSRAMSRAAARATAVWGQTTRPYAFHAWAISARVRSSSMDTAAASARRAASRSGARSTAPSRAKVSKNARVASASRPVASNSRRSKFEGACTSMLTLAVGLAAVRS